MYVPRKCSIQWACFVCCLSSLGGAGPAGASWGHGPRPLSLSLEPRGRAMTLMRPLPPVHWHRPLGHHVPALFQHLRGQRGSPEVIHAVGMLEWAYDPVSATYSSLKNCLCDLLCSNFCVPWINYLGVCKVEETIHMEILLNSQLIALLPPQLYELINFGLSLKEKRMDEFSV